MKLDEDQGINDIAGTTIFDARQARKGFHLNRFCMSLMDERNRARFKEDERSYLDEWPLTETQKQAILDRDWNRAIAEGGHIYYLAKIIACDGSTFAQAASSMAGLTVEQYSAMMLAGGRSPHGNRATQEG